MPDLTWEEFALALAPSLGVPGKPSHELTVVAERVYDALVLAGVDVRAVVAGETGPDTRSLRKLAEDVEAALNRKPDLSRLRELEAKWRAELTQQEKVRDSVLSMKEYGATSKAAVQVHCEAMALRLQQLTAALDAIEKGGA